MFYTTKEVAAKLAIPTTSLRAYIRSGAIACGRRPGNTVYAFSDRQLKEAISLFEDGGLSDGEAIS